MNAADGRLAEGTVINARWRVADLLGLGELSEVYEAHDLDSGPGEPNRGTSPRQSFALKLFCVEAARYGSAWNDYVRQARAAAAIGLGGRERGVFVTPFEFGVDQQTGLPYAVFERVSLPALDQLVSTVGTLIPEQVCRMLTAIAPALDTAHQAGLVHRCLKPQNIFTAAQDARATRITDFGTSLLRAACPPYPGWSATPGWVAPEAISPKNPSTVQMDIFALGLVAFYAMTARVLYASLEVEPFEAKRLQNEMARPIRSVSELARERGALLAPRLDPWFARALAAAPKQRFQSVKQMAGELRERLDLRDGGSPLARAESEPPVSRAEPGIFKATVKPLVFAKLPQHAPGSAEPGPAASEAVSRRSPAVWIVTAALGAGGLVILAASLFAALRHVAQKPIEAEASAAAESSGATTPSPARTIPASVTFQCEPEPCDHVTCDGERYETRVMPVSMTPGSHDCRAERHGFEAVQFSLKTTAGESIVRKVALTSRNAAPSSANESPSDRSAATAAEANGEATPPRTTSRRSTGSTSKAASTPKPGSAKKPCGTFINPCR